MLWFEGIGEETIFIRLLSMPGVEMKGDIFIKSRLFELLLSKMCFPLSPLLSEPADGIAIGVEPLKLDF